MPPLLVAQICKSSRGGSERKVEVAKGFKSLPLEQTLNIVSRETDKGRTTVIALR